MMTYRNSLPEVLQQFHEKGYHLAEQYLSLHSEDSIRSTDWRLDSVKQIQDDTHWGTRMMIVAVSSLQRSIKLVFVQPIKSQKDVSPVGILKRLFPTAGARGIN
jgi:hypothetical protein